MVYPYACLQLSQTQGRESIAAKLVANLLTEAGANRVLACDLHSGQSIGYFDIPVDHVYGQVNDKSFGINASSLVCDFYFCLVILSYEESDIKDHFC